MSTYRVLEVPAPAGPRERPDWRLVGATEVSADCARALLGNIDLVDSPEAANVSLANQDNVAKHVFVACAHDAADGEASSVLGVARVYLPRLDNLHLAEVEVEVRPGARRRGVGAALWERALADARAGGRTTITAFHGEAEEPAADDPAALTSPTGNGRVSSTDPGARFARSRGFTLEQVERHSQLDLPVPAADLARFREESQAHAGDDYELITWQEAVPDEWIDSFCVLQTSMSTDAPVGGLSFEEEVWDAERVRRIEKLLREAGQHSLTAAALHRPSGEVVAFTELATAPDKPEVIYQENTIVRADHRGHRLGMLVKAANLEQLARERPGAKRVHTWNAQENSYMLAINVPLGFRQASVWGGWQLTL